MANGLWGIFLLKIAISGCDKIYGESKRTSQETNILKEYELFLDKFEVDYDEKYIFHEPE